MKKKVKAKVKTINRRVEAWVEGIWTGSVAVLAGLAGLYFGSICLIRSGFPMGFWSSSLFIFPALVMCIAKKPSPEGLFVLGGIVFLIFAAILLASQFHDFSWDGMGARQSIVEKIGQGESLAGVPVPHLLSAWIYSNTGDINAAKAVNLIAAVGAFGCCLKLFSLLPMQMIWKWVLALTCALNPVAIYQLSSFYIDGFTGSIMTCLICVCGIVLIRPHNHQAWICLLLSFALLAASKTSGLAYGVLFLFPFGVALLFLVKKEKENIFKRLGIMILILFAGWWGHGLGRGGNYTLDYLRKASDLTTPGYGIGPSSFAPEQAKQMHKLEVFARSHFAPTCTMTDQWEWKNPFYFSRPELAMFEDLNADPRSGGFGPLYGGVCLLALGSFLVAASKAPLQSCLWAFPAFIILASCLFSQAWWARWVPQGWLVPLALALPQLSNGAVRLSRALAMVSVALALLNSILILAFYTSGCIQNESILRGQLRFLKNMPQPIQVYIPTFLSNFTWLKDAGISFEILKNEPKSPKLVLQRTNSKVSLKDNWPAKNIDKAEVEVWKKRKLIED